MTGRATLIAAAVAFAIAGTGDVVAQTPARSTAGLEALRQQVERRFELSPLLDGVLLRPKTTLRGVRSIEVTGGTIAVDGTAVSGAELRNRIGDAADLVIQVSYLDADARRALFESLQPAPPSLPQLEAPNPPSAPDIPSPPQSGRRNRNAGRDWNNNGRVNLGGNVYVGPDEVVDGDSVAVGGSARIEGTVRGDVVAVGGNVDLGARAVVEGDVAVIGGSLRRADGARIDGTIKEFGFGSIRGNWFRPQDWFGRWTGSAMGSTFAFVSTVTRTAVLCLLAALVVLLAGRQVDRVSLRAASEPFKAGAIGLLAQLLFLPLLIITILVLVVTIIGIPLLALIPFVLLGLGLIGLLGFTAVAHELGSHLGRRLGWQNPGAYVTTFAGIVAIILPVLLARLALLAGGTGVSLLWHALAFMGFLVEYLAWTVGFGAVALVRFGRKGSSDDAQLAAGTAS